MSVCVCARVFTTPQVEDLLPSRWAGRACAVPKAWRMQARHIWWLPQKWKSAAWCSQPPCLLLLAKPLVRHCGFLGPAMRLLSSVCHILSSLKRISGAIDADSLRTREVARAAVMQICKLQLRFSLHVSFFFFLFNKVFLIKSLLACNHQTCEPLKCRLANKSIN